MPHGPNGKPEAVSVDSHHHIWDESVRDAPWAQPFPGLHKAFSVDDLAPVFVENVIDAGIAALGRRPNCAVKLSGLTTVGGQGWTVEDLRPLTDHVLASFGPDRVMYGSDWPVCLIAASYTEVALAATELTDTLSGAERKLVFGGTAQRWYAR